MRVQPDTEARRLLCTALRKPRRVKLTTLATELGVGRMAIYSWARGMRRPEAHLRAALERLLAIPAETWMTEEEREIAFGSNESAA